MDTKQLIETVTKARRGDSAALQELYLDMYKSVYYLALRIVKNPEDAEDITQEVYITVQQKIPELREPAAFYGWVNQITVNQCNALLRKYRGLSRLDDEDEIINLIDDDPANLPDKALDDEATRKIILEVIDNLPDGQRACVILYYYTQNTIAQIADMLETNESTVKSRLSLARAKIRAALEHKAEKEGIKLWGIPLALTPILREAFEQFVMPEGAETRILEFISKATVENMNTGDSPGADTSGNSGTSGRIGPKSGTGGVTATKNITKAVISMSTKKIITTVVVVILAAAVITAGVIFLPPLFSSDDTTPPGVTDTETPIDTSKGTYEGEYDANGKRSGYGVWVYDNFRYEGYWENDMPNGEGTLYEEIRLPENREPNQNYVTKNVVSGNWIGGFSSGTITLNWVMESGETFTWTLDTANGYPMQDGVAYTADGSTNLTYKKTTLMGGVPPWADVETDPTPVSADNNTPEPDPTPGKTYDKPVVLLPDPENINEEYLAHMNGGMTIGYLGGAEAVDNYLDEIYEEYGRFLNENISKNCVKLGIFSLTSSDEDIGGITSEALKKVNELLKTNGEKPLDNMEDPKQKITALWIAASLYYDPDYNNEYQSDFWQAYPGWRFDIAQAFALARHSEQEDIDDYRGVFSSKYSHLFNITGP